MKEKIKNKKLVYTIIGIISVLLVALALTYAYWLITKSQTGQNALLSACLDISITNEANDIALSNQFPMSDEDGMKLTPYTFKVTNNCNTAVDYHVNLESIGDASTAIKASAIKAVLNEEEPKQLYDYVGAETTLKNAYEAYILGYGTLAAKGNVTYELRMWIDENAPISEMNKTFESKITVLVGQGISAQGTELATLILEDAEANNYLYSTTPDFSTVTADGEYGLYTAQDDYGTSYYYRGDVENNYVKFGHYSTPYVPADIPEEVLATEDGQLFASMVFGSKSTCESNGVLINSWTTCEENKDIINVYYSNTGMEEQFGMAGFTTEQSCLATGVDSCEELEDIKVSMYWRILRINGDGSVRLVYDGTSAVANSNNHDAAVGISPYNTNNDDAKYVGYTYDDGTGTQMDSTIKVVIDNWYTNNLEQDYGKYIADSIFCNDREIVDVIDNNIYYAAYDRLVTNRNPKLTCTQTEDKYTVNSIKGNGYLTYPIGLMTADEMILAGILNKVKNGQSLNDTINKENYLYTNSELTSLKGTWGHWSLTPDIFDGNELRMFGELLTTMDFPDVMETNFGVRPVINIKTNTLFTGSGIIDDPYKLAD